MSNKYQRRLEEVMSLLPCPVSGCWFRHGAETYYSYDTGCASHVLEVWPVAVAQEGDAEGNGHEGTGILYGEFLSFHTIRRA